MRVVLAATAVLALALAPVGLPVSAPESAVKVLDDFESDRVSWTGDYLGGIVTEYSSHGSYSFKVLFRRDVEYPGFSAAGVDLQWSGFDTLRMDFYNPQGVPVNLEIRIDDDKSVGYSSRYNGNFLLVNGQTFLEIPFSRLAAGDRPLDLSNIKSFTIFMSSPPADTVLYFDNIRVTRGPEAETSRGRAIVLASDDPAVSALEEKAREARARLDALVSLAHQRGIGTLEPNIALVTARLGLDIRPGLPWFAGRKAELYSYVADSCNDAYRALTDTLQGRRSVAPVPPVYNTAGLRFAGSFLAAAPPPGIRPPSPSPVLLFSMLYHTEGPLCEYFTPVNYFVHTHSFAGAGRYDVERAPIYAAFREYPDTHRVWNADEGWCGHIIRDSASLGGGKEPVVICLESPRTRDAIVEYVRLNAPRWHDDPNVRVNVMGGELSYICYCARTLELFRRYLREQHPDIAALNAVWGTAFSSFDQIDVMPNARQAADNRARWYDWQAFNCWRFVEHAKWAKSVIRDIDPEIPVSVGAVSYSLRADFGRSGVDEENLIRHVDDVVLNESGPSTITTDLLWSLSEGQKPILDFEYHGDVAGLLPHFLHGNTAIAMWWWPDRPDTEFPRFNETALPFSWDIPLADVAEALKIGLDVRRIAPEIAAFPSQSAQIAILYSRASMLQVPPEFLSGTKSPYTIEVENVYNAALGLDAPVRFISSKQVEEGKLSSYRMLIVPGAPYSYDSVARAVFDFAEAGGVVVVTPGSFLFDQYARPSDRLSRLGISVAPGAEESYRTSDLRRDAFLQGMVRETSAVAAAGSSITVAAGGTLPEGMVLDGGPLLQKLQLSGDARAVAFTADRAPALVEIPFGKGRFYYLALRLLPGSLNSLLDQVAARAAVSRPVRFLRAPGVRDWRVEGRSVKRGDAFLFYVTSHADVPLNVSVSVPFEPGDAVNLRDPWKKVNLDSLDLPPGRTGIYAVRPKEPRP